MTEIPRHQEIIHRVTEAGAVVTVAPFLLYLATRTQLAGWERGLAALFGVITLAVDGWLLTRWGRDSSK